jgi:hypothetical protein
MGLAEWNVGAPEVTAGAEAADVATVAEGMAAAPIMARPTSAEDMLRLLFEHSRERDGSRIDGARWAVKARVLVRERT